MPGDIAGRLQGDGLAALLNMAGRPTLLPGMTWFCVHRELRNEGIKTDPVNGNGFDYLRSNYGIKIL